MDLLTSGKFPNSAPPLHTHWSSALPVGPLGGLPSLSLTTKGSWVHLWGRVAKPFICFLMPAPWCKEWRLSWPWCKVAVACPELKLAILWPWSWAGSLPHGTTVTVYYRPVPASQCHHHVQRRQKQWRVKERVTVGNAISLIIPHNLTLLVLRVADIRYIWTTHTHEHLSLSLSLSVSLSPF